MFCVVCFDICDDRVRYRAVKILKSFGHRVQKSVFECAFLTEEQFLNLQNQLASTIDSLEDSVRYYKLCRQCANRIETSGIGEMPKTSEFQVV